MATLAELQGAFNALSDIFRNDLTPRYNAIRRGVDAGDTFAEVGSEITAIRAEFDNAYARIFELRQQAEQISPRPDDFIARLDRSLNTNQATNNAALATTEIRARENGERQLRESQTPTGATAAVEVTQEQSTNPNTAPAETVTADGQVVTPRSTTTPTNAVVTPTARTGDVDSGTDAPVRTLGQTQQVNDWASDTGAQFAPDQLEQQEPGAVPGVTVSDRNQTDPGFNPQLSASAISGTGAADDNPEPNSTTTQADANQAQANVIDIRPQGNILDRFHNYTYNASVYVLTPEQFALYQQQPKKTISGYNLLFQSGGAANGTGELRGAQAGRADSGIQDNRNPYFPLDYYIDSIQIENLLLGKATQAAHSVTNLKFTVIEPNGISLLDNIYRAVQDLNPTLSGRVNYAAAIYLMVIRFYGYDLDGRPVRVGSASETSTQTDPDAVVEKFIPFRIKAINWTVSNKLVNYDFEGVAVGQIVAAATRRGTIPADIQLSGATVKDMLQGDVIYSAKQAPNSAPGTSTTAGRPAVTDPGEIPGVTVGDRNQTDPGYVPPAPPKATAAGNKSSSLISGLVGAMNRQQQEKLAKKEIEVADVYEIEFAPNAEKISSARVTKPGQQVAKDFTSGAVPVSKGNTSGVSPDKQRMDVTSRNFAIPAGTQLLQAIDQIIRNSTYITDQSLFLFNEKTNRVEPNPKANKEAGFQWYNILMQATPLQYDNKRNDFAFRVKYTIVPYEPQEFFSEFFPVPRYRGIHKRYPYWFTGENTQVLDYQATFNKLFTVTVTGGPGENPLQSFRNKYSTSMRDYPFFQTQARSTESDVGADQRGNELAANAAEYLYNPSDNGQAKVRILGDPAWIQQGSSAGYASSGTVSVSPFNADGTINFDANDVLFEIAWQRPEDYVSDTGLADPYARTQKTFRDREPIQSVIYRARKCTSYFNQGRFEQDLEGTLYWFPLPDGTNKAPGAAAPPATQASVRAVDNAIDAGAAAGNNRKTTLFDSSGQTYDLYQQSAVAGLGGEGLRLPPTVPQSVSTLGSGQFTFPQANDLLPALPAGPVISDGLDVTADDIAPVGRFAAATADDIAGATNNISQRISRET